jgi:hypothetical protein
MLMVLPSTFAGNQLEADNTAAAAATTTLLILVDYNYVMSSKVAAAVCFFREPERWGAEAVGSTVLMFTAGFILDVMYVIPCRQGGS